MSNYVEYEWWRPDGTLLLRDTVDSRMDFGPGATVQQAQELAKEPELILRRREGGGTWKTLPIPDWARYGPPFSWKTLQDDKL